MGMIGTPQDSEAIEGIALRKNVSRKGSNTAVKNAAVYLLGSSVELSDSDRKALTSLDHPSLHGAMETRGKAIKRLAGLTPVPDVLLVRGPVDRLVQDALHAHGITLVQGLKPSLMQRLARSTGAEVAASLEELEPRNAALCQEFSVQELYPPQQVPPRPPSIVGPEQGSSQGAVGRTGSGPWQGSEAKAIDRSVSRTSATVGRCRTLMHFRGLSRSIAATVLLRGASVEELQGVKHVLQFAIYAAYKTGRLEVACLADIMASAVASLKDVEAAWTPAETPRVFRGLGLVSDSVGEAFTPKGSVGSFSFASSGEASERPGSAGDVPPLQARPLTPDDADKPRHHLPGPQRPSIVTLLLSDGNQTSPVQGAALPQPSSSSPNPSIVVPSSSSPGASLVVPEAACGLASASLAYLEDIAESTAWASADTVRLERSGQPIMSTSPHITVGPDMPMLSCAGPGDPLEDEEDDCGDPSCSEDPPEEEFFPVESRADSFGSPLTPSDVFREPLRESLRSYALSEDEEEGDGGVGARRANGSVGRGQSAEGRAASGLLSASLLRGSPVKSARRSTSASDLDPLSRAARELYATDPLHSTASSALLALEEFDDRAEERAGMTAIEQLQHLWLSEALRNPSKNLLCETSRMKRIELYADALPSIHGSMADTPLCTFLAGMWPKGDAGKAQQCKHRGCGDEPQSHLRFFLRGGRMVSLAVTRLRSDRRLPGGDRGIWWTWTRPQHVSEEPLLSVRRCSCLGARRRFLWATFWSSVLGPGGCRWGAPASCSSTCATWAAGPAWPASCARRRSPTTCWCLSRSSATACRLSRPG
eukprot:jgi/Botrbrau1/13697/Bobra.0261s0007.1